MKTISFIFHQRAPYAVDWKSLVQGANPEDLFIMVTTAECDRQLSETDKRFFDAIEVIDGFNFDKLVPVIGDILKSHYQASDQVRIAVLSEFTMTVAADIRDHFKPQYDMRGPGRAEIDYFRDKSKMKELFRRQVCVFLNIRF